MHHWSSRWQSLLCFVCGLILVLTFQLNSPAQGNSTDPIYQAAVQEFQLGQQYYDQQNYNQSLRNLQEAQRLFSSGQYPLQLAIVQSNLALVYHKLGQSDAAFDVIEASLANPEISKHPQVEARALDIRAKLLYFRGRYQDALKDWQRAQPLYVKTADRVGQITNQLNQAYAYLSLGQHANYYELLEQLEKQIADPNFQNQFSPTGNQQLVTQQVTQFLRTVGKYKEAIAFLEPQAARHPEQLDYQLQLAQLWQHEGDRTLDGDAYFQTAVSPWQCAQLSDNQSGQKADYGRAIDIYQHILDRQPSPSLKVPAQIQLLQLLYKTHQEGRAQQLAPQIVLSGLMESRELVSREIELAKAINCVDQRQVLGLLNQAQNHAESLQDRYSASKAMGNLGGYYAKRVGDLAQAQDYTQAAWAIAQNLKAPYLGYQWLWQLGQIEKQANQPKTALAHYANAATKLATVRRNFVHLSQDLQFSFLQDVRPFYREYLALLLDDGAPENLKQAEKVVTDLQLAEVEDFLRCQSTDLKPLIEIAHPDATIIYPILLGDRLELIAELPDGQVVKQIDQRGSCDPVDTTTLRCSELINISDFYNDIDNFKQDVKAKRVNLTALQRSGKNLYQALIQPLEPYLPSQGTLVFVVDGYLQGLPFAALYDGNEYLIQKHSLAVSIGAQFEANSTSNNNLSSVVFAGINQYPEFWATEGLSELPNIQKEYEGISRELDALLQKYYWDEVDGTFYDIHRA
ncbi:MAG: CHAT domain-containing protein, partial [Spirulinaceae cyanobacterium]